MTKKYIRLVYGILLTIAICICGVSLIVACVDIYNFQPGSFSRESVAAAFGKIQYSLFGCLAMVIGGFIIDAFARPEEKQKPEKQYETILQNLHKKADLTKCEPELAKAIGKKRTWRMALQGGTAGILTFCSMVFLRYALSGQNYPEDANAAVVQAMPLFFLCLAIPCCCAIFTAYHKRISMRREIELVKKAIAVGAKAESVLPKKDKKQIIIFLARYGILAIAVVVLVAGFCFGGTADVLAKAAAICTECVGLG